MNNNLLLNNDVSLYNLSGYEEVIGRVMENWKLEGHTVVNYIYWASYPLIGKDEKYTSALKASDFVLPDGIGMYLYVRNTLNVRINNLNGTDLNPLFIEHFTKNNLQVAFYGANEENITKAVADKNFHPYYFQNGYSELEWNKIIEGSVLMVGLGSPKQEIWVNENIDIIKQKRLLVITVGGFFDFLSGKYKRAPLIIRKMKLEWLWRAPHCSMKRNLRNLYLPFYIIRDKKHIKHLNNL